MLLLVTVNRFVAQHATVNGGLLATRTSRSGAVGRRVGLGRDGADMNGAAVVAVGVVLARR